MAKMQTVIGSPLGPLTLQAEKDCLTGLWLPRCRPDAQAVEIACSDLPLFVWTKDWLDAYFSGRQPAVSEIPLNPSGSDFRKTVWNRLLDIPYGATVTYGQLARELFGPRMAPQAIGGAVGHNPISILIPCHRVLGAGGRLTGYGGGLEEKCFLLRLEGILPAGEVPVSSDFTCHPCK